MKYLIPLQAVSSEQAYRGYLRTYARIELSERGKPETWRFLLTYEMFTGKNESG